MLPGFQLERVARSRLLLQAVTLLPQLALPQWVGQREAVLAAVAIAVGAIETAGLMAISLAESEPRDLASCPKADRCQAAPHRLIGQLIQAVGFVGLQAKLAEAIRVGCALLIAASIEGIAPG